MEENKKILNNLLDKYSLTLEEKNELLGIIYPMFRHNEFQRRMSKEFLHHSDITLGSHIIEDSILTYLYSKKYMQKHENYRLDLAVRIAFLHDLYTLPWQNREKSNKYFFNKHGFTHPIEAVINAYNWYPEVFNEKDREILIDGIIHHMFPLPVRRVDNKKFYINNLKILDSLPIDIKNIINNSLKRKKIGIISISRSIYKEGRIMSKADKKVSIKQIKNIDSFKALLTGKNKSID